MPITPLQLAVMKPALTPHEILKRFPNASKSTIARNAVAGLPSAEPQRRNPQPLVQKERARQSADGPRYRVTIISLRAAQLDDDNLRGGAKALRDAIADRIGLDDNERNIEWIYGQMKSPKHGTIVMIERL